jgi:hypothetical protein
MKKKSLATYNSVSSIGKDNDILISRNGTLMWITLTDLVNSVQANDLQINHYAWGIPLNQNSSNPEWGKVGNPDMWEEYKSQIGCYLLTNDGRASKIQNNNRSIFADGTEVNESLGNVMFHAPRLYYAVTEDQVTKITYLWMSQYPLGGHYIEESWIGCYKGSLTNTGILKSRKNTTPETNQTIETFWSSARKNGEDFGIMSYNHWKLMTMLYLSEYGNTNSQSNIGAGFGGNTDNGGEYWDFIKNFTTGGTYPLGDACGKVDLGNLKLNEDTIISDANQVSLFGVEDLWGWTREFIQGVYCINNNVYFTDENRVDFIENPTSYRSVARVVSDIEDFTKSMQLGEYFDLIPANNTGGSNSSYYCDASLSPELNKGNVLIGGQAAHGYKNGLFNISFYPSEEVIFNNETTSSARLAYYGKYTIVDGKDLENLDGN